MTDEERMRRFYDNTGKVTDMSDAKRWSKTGVDWEDEYFDIITPDGKLTTATGLAKEDAELLLENLNASERLKARLQAVETALRGLSVDNCWCSDDVPSTERHMSYCLLARAALSDESDAPVEPLACPECDHKPLRVTERSECSKCEADVEKFVCDNIPADAPAGYDLIAHLVRQRRFSSITFGTEERRQGVIDHIRHELIEVEEDPDDLEEWVDVVLLALDGAWRTGATPQEITAAIDAKMTKNENRDWPDWRTADPDKAIEHDRTKDAPAEAAESDACEQCGGHGWYAWGDTDDPQQVQCAACEGTGKPITTERSEPRAGMDYQNARIRDLDATVSLHHRHNVLLRAVAEAAEELGRKDGDLNLIKQLPARIDAAKKGGALPDSPNREDD